MKTNPSLVKQKLPLGKGDAWIEVTSSHFAFVDFRAHPDGIECLRVPTGTNHEKQRAIDALRSVADFLESKMDATEVSPCDPLSVMRRTKSSNKSVRKCQKAVGPAGSRIRRCGKRSVNRTAIRRRNDGLKPTKLDLSKIPPCNCGSKTFALVGSDGGMYFAVQCESCRKEYVFRVRGRKLTMLRQID